MSNFDTSSSSNENSNLASCSSKNNDLVSNTQSMRASSYCRYENEFNKSDDAFFDDNYDERNQSFTSICLNSIELLVYYIISFLFLNRLQLFFQYLFMNSSINNIDDYETPSESIQTETTKTTTTATSARSSNYMNTFLIFITIALIMLTLYIYIFLIYFHVIKIESKLSEIQKLFDS